MADRTEEEKRQQELVEELKTTLSEIYQHLTKSEALIPSKEARDQGLQYAAALTESARGTLRTITEAKLPEVVEIFLIPVVTSDPVVNGMSETVAISGVVDPRLSDSDHQ